MLWLFPNFRTVTSTRNFHPLTTEQKFRLATTQTFDRGNIALVGLISGFGELTHAEPSFGQGFAGYARYYGTTYASLTIGNYLTQAVYPTLFHQDPRYFRKGTGGWSRVGYALSQVFWTYSDRGVREFNYSQVLGLCSTVAITRAYYPDRRTAYYASERLGVGLGLDMLSNVLKEYWPDIDRKLLRRHERAIP